MKKGNKEILKTILSNQALIMKALKIEVPVKKIETEPSKILAPKKLAPKKAVAKTAVAKKIVKKSAGK